MMVLFLSADSDKPFSVDVFPLFARRCIFFAAAADFLLCEFWARRCFLHRVNLHMFDAEFAADGMGRGGG